MKKLTQDQAISKCQSIHGDRYDYSKVKYISNSHKIEIICKEHGSFWQKYMHHAKGHGCKRCFYVGCSIKQRSNLRSRIDKANLIHNNKYDYSNIKEYTNVFQKVPIICKVHGIFYQSLKDHLKGCGCKQCRCITTEQFISKAILIHGDRFDYSKTIVDAYRDKVIIICKEHGEFQQRVGSHLEGYGCMKCNKSHGEIMVSNILKEIDIDFKEQHSFKDCRYKHPLEFDFFIPSKNTLIEYDGKQHFVYNPNDLYCRNYPLIKKRDEIKNDYCLKNNISLIRLPYTLTENQIREILEKELFNSSEVP